MTQPAGDLCVCHLGVVPYSEGLVLQEKLRERRLAGAIPDTLLLLEHPPTYTHGRRSGAQDLPMPESFYRDKGIAVFATDRGGKVTYHGPGQLVGYPIMAIADVGRYLRTLERAIIDALWEVGVAAYSRHREGIDYTGVWVGGSRLVVDGQRNARMRREPAVERATRARKIASIGVHVSHGVTTHGFAVNVHNDLEPFSWIVACGLPDVVMTSLALEAADGCWAISDRSARRFREPMAHSFVRAFSRRQRLVEPSRLGIGAASAPDLDRDRRPTVERALV
jgi:lipoate-protein ligase B